MAVEAPRPPRDSDRSHGAIRTARNGPPRPASPPRNRLGRRRGSFLAWAPSPASAPGSAALCADCLPVACRSNPARGPSRRLVRGSDRGLIHAHGTSVLWPHEGADGAREYSKARGGPPDEGRAAAAGDGGGGGKAGYRDGGDGDAWE